MKVWMVLVLFIGIGVGVGIELGVGWGIATFCGCLLIGLKLRRRTTFRDIIQRGRGYDV